MPVEITAVGEAAAEGTFGAPDVQSTAAELSAAPEAMPEAAAPEAAAPEAAAQEEAAPVKRARGRPRKQADDQKGPYVRKKPYVRKTAETAKPVEPVLPKAPSVQPPPQRAENTFGEPPARAELSSTAGAFGTLHAEAVLQYLAERRVQARDHRQRLFQQAFRSL